MDAPETKPATRPLWVYISSILFLAVVAAGTLYVIKTHKKPGQMTMIESQAMDMTAMKAPVGSVPVELETVSHGHFEAAVAYAGSVVPFTEQEVYPRVEGYISSMTVYPGDAVRAGQVLARLESPDVSQRIAAASDDAVAARQSAAAAGDDTARMKQMVQSAAAEVDAMRADLEYRQAEYARVERLFKAGAMSRSELEQERAMLASAEASVQRAEAEVRAAKSNRKAAERQQQAMGTMAAASGRRAAAERVNASWLELRSPITGIVTERLVSPGTLARPGAAVLRLAEISRVRLQANVSMSDAALISTGSRIEVTSPRYPGKTFEAAVTSVFPSADSTTRTVTVEAIADNPGRRYLPGDYISMKIFTADTHDALAVPERAVVRWGNSGRPSVWVAIDTGGKGGKKLYTCVMHPEVISDKPGDCPKCKMALVPKKTSGKLTAHLAEVETGESSGDRVRILKGLSEGDRVVVNGVENVAEGSVLFETKWTPDGPAELPPPPAMEGGMPGMAGKASGKKGDMDNMPGMDHSAHKAVPAEKKESSKLKPKSKSPSGEYYYTCPMHPEVVSDKPGRCPKCGMDLVEKKK